MTANYFMVTRDGKGLDRSGPSGPTFASGSGPTTRAVADQGFTNNFASSLSPWTGSSYNYDTGVSGGFDPTLVSGRARLNIPSGINGDTGLYREMWTTWDDATVTAEVPVTAIVNGQSLSFQATWRGATSNGAAQFSIEGGNLMTKVTAQGAQDNGAYNPTNHRWLRMAEKDGQFKFSVSPDGTNWVVVDTRTHGFPAPNGVDAASLSLSLQNSATAFAALEAFLDSVTVQIGAAPVGADPAMLAAWTGYGTSPHAFPGLFKPRPGLMENVRDMLAPTGFCESVFRVVRDPAIATDDSGDTLGTQVYNHGWLIGVWLVCYLQEQNGYGGRPIAWPADGGYKVLPVTGTPVVTDGKGFHGLQSVTWPGSGVGIGTLRQLVSGDEGSTRKVAAILDLLAATTSAQRTTIASTLASTPGMEAAQNNMRAAIAAASDTVRNQFVARSELAAYLARQATSAGLNSPTSALEFALTFGMYAIVAKEAGLIGATFTTANYETVTQPIDAVLAMPSGY